MVTAFVEIFLSFIDIFHEHVIMPSYKQAPKSSFIKKRNFILRTLNNIICITESWLIICNYSQFITFIRIGSLKLLYFQRNNGTSVSRIQGGWKRT